MTLKTSQKPSSTVKLYPWFQCSTLKCCCSNNTVYCEALLHYLKSYTARWSLDIVIEKSSAEFLSDVWQQHADRNLFDDQNIEKIETDIKQKVNYINSWKPSQPPWSVSFLQPWKCLKSVRAQIHDGSKSDTRWERGFCRSSAWAPPFSCDSLKPSLNYVELDHNGSYKFAFFLLPQIAPKQKNRTRRGVVDIGVPTKYVVEAPVNCDSVRIV